MRDKVKMAFVKPIEGATVRDPNTFAPMPPEGINVVLTGRDGKFWRRRINDGSLIVVKKEKVSKTEIKPKMNKAEFKKTEDDK